MSTRTTSGPAPPYKSNRTGQLTLREAGANLPRQTVLKKMTRA
jgi:hypothetical protein